MRHPTVEDRLEYLGVVLFATGARRLSTGPSLVMGAAVGRLAFDFVRFRRTVTLGNLKSHLLTAGWHGSHVGVGRGSYANFGRALAESATGPASFSGMPGVNAAPGQRR
jgi:hypothetical protein